MNESCLFLVLILIQMNLRNPRNLRVVLGTMILGRELTR
jgi:hypothetical protein